MISAKLYQHVLKPILFRFDPERVHNGFSYVGGLLGSTRVGRAVTRMLFSYEHPALHTVVAGISFANPIGLAAGFDKNARLTEILPDLGFGFAEIGSITGKPCAGNPRPRLWRIPKQEAIQVYYGLMNDGADTISDRMRNKKFRFPVGISTAKTNDATTVEPDAAIADYAHGVRRFCGIGDYFAINISCPNTCGGEPFTDPVLLDRLLGTLDSLVDKPVFLKLAVDLSEAQLVAIVAACAGHRVDGFICSNLTKDNALKNLPGLGGVSGRPVRHRSDRQIAYLYQKTKGAYAIIGVGGVFTAEDAYRKIRLGASLVQLITGMIYRGPQLIGQINRDLVSLLVRDGFSSISQAVGADHA